MISRQDKTRQGKTRQDKTRQDKERQDKTSQPRTERRKHARRGTHDAGVAAVHTPCECEADGIAQLGLGLDLVLNGIH